MGSTVDAVRTIALDSRKKCLIICNRKKVRCVVSKQDITIKEIQDWEKSFTAKKGISTDEQKASFIAVCKLMEEAGEMTKDLLEKNWDEIQAEVTDVIVFACKIANIAEEYHGADSLSDVMRRKIAFSETRVYDKSKNKLDKPKHKEFH
jgi:NTP pyrophosphatase (non-canonical NTP hydrolase)